MPRIPLRTRVSTGRSLCAPAILSALAAFAGCTNGPDDPTGNAPDSGGATPPGGVEARPSQDSPSQGRLPSGTGNVENTGVPRRSVPARPDVASEAAPVVFAIESFPTNLDPRFSVDAYSSRIGRLLFSSLTAPGADGRRAPDLAESWQQTSPTTWRFDLGNNHAFCDPRRPDEPPRLVTAKDVAATYRSVMAVESGSPKRAMLESVTAVEAPDPRTLVFRLSRNDSAFLEATGIGILPADLTEENGPLPPDRLIGSKPFIINNFRDDDEVRLRRSPCAQPAEPPEPENTPGSAGNSAARDAPARTIQVEELVFRSIPDGVMRSLELRHGSVDLVQNALDPDTAQWLEENEKAVRLLNGPYDAFQYLGMNLDHEALGNVLVRRALAYAIDREAIVRYVLRDQARIASGMLPPHHWAHEKDVRRYRPNQALARALLDAAGYPDPPGPEPRLRLNYKTTTVELRRRIAEVFADQLKAVGIILTITSHEWGTFFSDVRRGNFELYSLAWVGIRDPDLYRTSLHSDFIPPHGNNRGRFRDRRFDRLASRGVRRSGAARARVYSRIQRYAARELPVIPLWWPRQIVAVRDRIEGFELHPGGDLGSLTTARIRLGRPEAGSD